MRLVVFTCENLANTETKNKINTHFGARFLLGESKAKADCENFSNVVVCKKIKSEKTNFCRPKKANRYKKSVNSRIKILSAMTVHGH